jgi:hypothetical protein
MPKKQFGTWATISTYHKKAKIKGIDIIVVVEK